MVVCVFVSGRAFVRPINCPTVYLCASVCLRVCPGVCLCDCLFLRVRVFPCTLDLLFVCVCDFGSFLFVCKCVRVAGGLRVWESACAHACACVCALGLFARLFVIGRLVV